jgi:hypothetical protein
VKESSGLEAAGRECEAATWVDGGGSAGLGSHHFRDTSRYEGQFQNDDMHGMGTFYYINGSIYQVTASLGAWKLQRGHCQFRQEGAH